MEISQNNIKVTYSDRPMFVFNKNTIRISSVDVNPRYYTVTIGEHSIKVAKYGGNVEVDISGLLALCLEMPYTRHTYVVVAVEDSLGNSTAIRVEAVLGTIIPSDVIEGMPVEQRVSMLTRNVTWFCRFPFTLSYYAISGQKAHSVVRGQDDGDGIQSTTEITKNGIYDVEIPTETCGAKSRIVILDGNDNSSAFTDPFTYQFWQLGKESTAIYLNANYEKDGWYLRWIDRKGFWQQFLFTKGTTTRKNELAKERKEYDINVSGFTFSATRPIVGSLKETVKCCATRLHREALECASSIVESVYVEIYRGNDTEGNPIWQPVTLETSNITLDDNKVMGDVEIQFTTEYNSQRL